MTSSQESVRFGAGLVGGAVCFFSSFCIYLLSLAPTVQGFDSAELTMGSYSLGFVHPTGYPLYMLVGHLFSRIPIGDVGYRLNLMSAFFGSLTVLGLFALLLYQTRNWFASLTATALFALSPLFWSQAIRAEVYTLHTAIVMGVLLACLLAYQKKQIAYTVICSCMLGLGSGNHMTIIFLWASILINTFLMGARERKTHLLAAMPGILIAGLLYMYFPWRSAANPQIDYIRPYFHIDPGSLSGLWWMITGQAFRCSVKLDASSLVQQLARLARYLWSGSLGFGLVLGILGWWKLQKTHSQWNRLLTLYLLCSLVMFVVYNVVDEEVMFLPVHALICIWAANGIGVVEKWVTNRVRNAIHVNVFVNAALMVVIALSAWLDWSYVSLKDDRRVYDTAAQVLSQLEPSAILVNHWVTASVYDYLRLVEGRRPDVSGFNIDFFFLGVQKRCTSSITKDPTQAAWLGWLDDYLGKRPLCFIEPLPPVPVEYSWYQRGGCWTLNSGASQP
jgi:hypothetical protein